MAAVAPHAHPFSLVRGFYGDQTAHARLTTVDHRQTNFLKLSLFARGLQGAPPPPPSLPPPPRPPPPPGPPPRHPPLNGILCPVRRGERGAASMVPAPLPPAGCRPPRDHIRCVRVRARVGRALRRSGETPRAVEDYLLLPPFPSGEREAGERRLQSPSGPARATADANATIDSGPKLGDLLS